MKDHAPRRCVSAGTLRVAGRYVTCGLPAVHVCDDCAGAYCGQHIDNHGHAIVPTRDGGEEFAPLAEGKRGSR